MALTVQIQKRYGDFRLDVDFTAEDGQALALLGASRSEERRVGKECM